MFCYRVSTVLYYITAVCPALLYHVLLQGFYCPILYYSCLPGSTVPCSVTGFLLYYNILQLSARLYCTMFCYRVSTVLYYITAVCPALLYHVLLQGFYCPILYYSCLPGSTVPCSVTGFLLSYIILQLSALYACDPADRPYKASRSNTFFMIVLLVTFFLCAFPVGYTIAV